MLSKLRKCIALLLCMILLLQTAAAVDDAEQYGYDESPAEQVTVTVTLSSDGIPLRGSDGTALAHLEVTVPYFDLALYDLQDFYRYGTSGGQGAYTGTQVIQRPTLLHLYLYLLERYYMGLPEDLCCKGTSDVLQYNEAISVWNLLGEKAYDANCKAMNPTGSATSLYMQQFWGHDENLLYYRNHLYPLMSSGWGATCDYILLSDGDTIDLAMYADWSFWSTGGSFSKFDQDAYTARAGDTLTVRTYRYSTDRLIDGDMGEMLPAAELTVGLYDANWEPILEVSNTDGSYTFPVPQTTGRYYLLGLEPNGGTFQARIAPATAVLEVTGDGAETPTDPTPSAPPSEPLPTDPTEPSESEPQPTEPEPTDPTEPSESEPQPTEPEPTDPTEPPVSEPQPTAPSEEPTEPSCPHSETVLRDAAAPDCTHTGYSGDLYCALCGALLQTGKELPATDCPSAAYADVERSRWYHLGVDFVIGNGYMTGTAPQTFAPDEALTRGQLVTILYRAAGEPAVVGKAPFDDVADGRFYSEAIAWAAQNGVVNGVGDGRFAPEGEITREQIATILYRYARAKPADAAYLAPFGDSESVSSFAKDAVSWAVATGLINGKTVGGGNILLLQPQGSATRAEFATILMRFLGNSQ